MNLHFDCTLYLVTDRDLMTTKTVEESVELAIKGGVTLVQLREKDVSSREFYQTALKVKKITAHYHVPLIINDRVDIALAADADGVHVGQSDLPADIVRRIIGPDKFLGVSAGNVEAAKQAVALGADHLGVGAMFATGTKTDAVVTSMDELNRIRQAVSVPIVVIGGIKKSNAYDFAKAQVDGLAVVSDIIAKQDITAAAREIKAEFLRGK